MLLCFDQALKQICIHFVTLLVTTINNNKYSVRKLITQFT